MISRSSDGRAAPPTSAKLPGGIQGWWLLCAVAVVVAFLHTSSMKATFDSQRYANVAHWLQAGRGLSASVIAVPVQDCTTPVEPGVHAFTLQPPGLPLFYAATGVGNRLVAHRILHLTAYGVLAWLVLRLALRVFPDRRAAYLAAVLSLASPVVLESVTSLWTDLPFAVLVLGALLAVIRSHDEGARPVPWLLLASGLAAAAVLMRYPGLGLFVLFATDGVLRVRRRGWRRGAVALVASFSIFGLTAVGLLLRNLHHAGSLAGACPHSALLAPETSLARGLSLLGWRFLHGLAPRLAYDRVGGFIGAHYAGPGGQALALGLVAVLVAVPVVLAVTRARRAGGDTATVPGLRAVPAILAVAAVAGVVLPLVRGSVHHTDFTVAEARYFVAVLPVVWIFVAWAFVGGRRPRVGLAVLAAIAAVHVAGVFGDLPEPPPAAKPWRSSARWVAENVPMDTPILSNNADILLEQDLGRRVYQISTWHFKNALPEDLRDEAGLAGFLARHDIGYVVLFGQASPRRMEYWGRALHGLNTGRLWSAKLVHSDRNIRVYRI